MKRGKENGMNRITVTGTVGSKEYIREFTYTKNGEQHKGMSFSLAVRDSYRKNPDGTPATQWMKVTLFRNLVNAGKFLYQGAKVTIHGTAGVEAFLSKKQKDEDGNPKPSAMVSIIASELDLPPKAANPNEGNADAQAPEAASVETTTVDESELPF